MQEIPVLIERRLQSIEATQQKIVELLSTNQSKKIEKKYLSAEEAADYLNMSLGTLYRHTMNQTIRFHRFSRKLYFLQKDLDHFITGQSQKSI